MRPAKLLVFLKIVVSSVRRSMRVRPLPETQIGETPLPIEAIGFSSRRSMAEATGLLRETVRRYVDELIAAGRLLVDNRGRVAQKPLLPAAPKGRPAVKAGEPMDAQAKAELAGGLSFFGCTLEARSVPDVRH